MEVGEGSSIARSMGRSWTTHTGSSGSSGAGLTAKKNKKKKSNGSSKPAWAPMTVPDWDGIPDETTSSATMIPSATSGPPGKGTEHAELVQKQSKSSSKKPKKRRTASTGVSMTESQPSSTAVSRDQKKKAKKEKRKATKRKQKALSQPSPVPPVTHPTRQQSANSAIFSISDDSNGPAPPSKKRQRKSAAGMKEKADVRKSHTVETDTAELRKQQQAEQQRRDAETAAAPELRPEEEQQLEKGAALLLRKLKSAATARHLAASADSGENIAMQTTAGASKNGNLHTQYKKKLAGARFRYLNEMLYTSKGADSFRQFQEDPDLFDVYHSGFREQVGAWPVNPVEIILKRLARLEERHLRRSNTAAIRFAVADFGCGDAAIAQSMTLCKSIVHSFDLVARNDWVTSTDMAHVPLPEGAVHAAVFSLALMGVNYIDYIVEAHRVLAPGGRLLIAEVHSRIDNFDKFEETISNVGFLKKAEDKSNKMFVLYEFERLTGRPLNDLDRQTLSVAELKPCIYKRR